MQRVSFFNNIVPVESEILDGIVGEIKIDSRTIVEGDIFIAIRGGNSYVEDVLEKGATLVFYDDPSVKITNRKAIYVEDSISFLQKIAKEYRETLDVL